MSEVSRGTAPAEQESIDLDFLPHVGSVSVVTLTNHIGVDTGVDTPENINNDEVSVSQPSAEDDEEVENKDSPCNIEAKVD